MHLYKYLFICLVGLLPLKAASQSCTFIENKGQWHANIAFAAAAPGTHFYAERGGFTYHFRDDSVFGAFMHEFHEKKWNTGTYTVKQHALKMRFYKPSAALSLHGSRKETAYHNYYLDNDPQHWASRVGLFGEILYSGLFKDIDLKVYSTSTNLKYDYIIKPGANVSQVQFYYEGANYLRLKEGYLYVGTSLGDMVETKPYAYQLVEGKKVQVACSYVFTGNADRQLVGFNVGAYDKSRELVIDPVLVFSTYSGSRGDNFGFTATYDERADLYAGGITAGGPGRDYPVTAGAFQVKYGGGAGLDPANLPCDITISKYDSAGTQLLFATYLGGKKDEYPHSLVVDQQNKLLVFGTTYSANFPVDTLGFDTSHNGGADIIVVKFSSDGTRMLGGTYVGGAENDGLNTNTLRYNYADDFRGDIIPDNDNHVYIASTTESSDFPLKNPSQSVKASTQDGCVFSLDSSLRKLQWSTFLGGNADDACYSVKLHDTGVYIGGGTASSSLSAVANGAFTTYQGGRADGFFARFSNKGVRTNFSYFGTNRYDQVYFIDFDENGKLYAAGQTEGSVTRSAGTYGKDLAGQFIVRYTSDFLAQELATTIGHRTNDPDFSPSAFLVDQCNNIYLSGWGSDISYDGLHGGTTANLPVSPDALQKTTDRNDFYLIVLGKNARTLLYATYFGGNRTEDHVDGGTSRFDKRGVVYQSVCSSCPNFPTQHFNDFPVTPGAVFDTNWSPRCSNAAFKIDFQITFEVDASFTAAPKNGCSPLNVIFTNTSKKGREYYWDFGDGSGISTEKSPKHTYTKAGTYKVYLTTVDSFSCNIAEMDSTEITVAPGPEALMEFEQQACSFLVSFKNKSNNATQPQWDFGDGLAGTEDNPNHIYENEGRYEVRLIVTHPVSGCKDTADSSLMLFGNPATSLKVPNIFTPGDDQLNDCYTVGGLNTDCDEAKIWIYDRWGVLVFKGELPQNCWNGRLSNNTKVTDGVYYFVLEVKKRPTNPSKHEDIRTSGIIQVVNEK